MPKTDHWRTDLKPPKVPPLIANCFKCGKEFAIKWVAPFKRYSLKNSWAYWTDNEEADGDKKICDNCLIHIYRNDKPYFWEKVKSPKKRNRVSDYLNDGSLVES